MDNFTCQHLQDWANATLHDDERDAVLNKMLAFVQDYPDVLERLSWPDIRTLAERNL